MKRGYDNVSLGERSLKYDFLAPMQRIIEKPDNPIGRAIILIVFGVLISTIIWAYFCKVDIVVSANGKIMPEEGLVVLKSETTGIIEEIYARDNECVDKNGIVYQVSQTEMSLQMEKLLHDKEILETQYEVYKKIKDNIPLDEIDTSKYGNNSNIAEAIIVDRRLCLGKEKEYEEAVSRGELSEEYSNNIKLENELELLQSINSLSVKLYEVNNDIDILSKQMEKTCIRSPVSGRVAQLQHKIPGAYVTEGETIGYVIPQNSQLIFEAFISDKDIGSIHEGNKVKIRLMIYDDTENEIVDGRINKIGEVALTGQESGSIYVADIILDDSVGLDKYIGTEGRCDVLIGERSVLDYFIDPFKKGLKNSLHER